MLSFKMYFVFRNPITESDHVTLKINYSINSTDADFDESVAGGSTISVRDNIWHSVVMYICVMGIDFDFCFYDLSITFRNCSNSDIFLFYSVTSKLTTYMPVVSLRISYDKHITVCTVYIPHNSSSAVDRGFEYQSGETKDY